MRPRPRGKKVSLGGGGGVPLIGLPSQQLHSHHTTGALGHVYKETPHPSPSHSNSIPEKHLKTFFNDVILEENLTVLSLSFQKLFPMPIMSLFSLSANQEIGENRQF